LPSLLLASVRSLIARPAGSGKARRSSDGRTHSVRGAGHLHGSPRSPRIKRREPLENKLMIGHRITALPLCRFVASCVPESLV